MLFALTMQSFLLICLVNKFRMYGGFAHLPVMLDLKTRKNYIIFIKRGVIPANYRVL